MTQKYRKMCLFHQMSGRSQQQLENTKEGKRFRHCKTHSYFCKIKLIIILSFEEIKFTSTQECRWIKNNN